MAGFHKVHCTNCGNICRAEQMAIDLDKLIRIHLEKMVTKSDNAVYQEAKRLLDEIRLGLFMTKFELANEGLLDQEGNLCLTAGYIFQFLSRRYQVVLQSGEVRQEESSSSTGNTEDLFADLFSDVDEQPPTPNIDSVRGKEVVPEDVLDSLCIKMLLYAEYDTEKSKKREYIESLIYFLMENKACVLLNCNCQFNVDRDDTGEEFISALRVVFLDGETKAFQHMVCPQCGEPFFIHAGKYEERVVVMLGSSRVGKTAYLAALVDEINPEYGQSNYPNIIVKDTSDAKYVYFVEHILKQYRLGRKILKTDESKDAVALFSLEVAVNGKTLILTLVDLPGEVFVPRGEDERKTGEASGAFIINHRRICYSADAFWFCIDPVQIDQQLQGINEQNEKADKVERDMAMVLSNIDNTINVMSDGEEQSKSSIPTAIIITKSDLINPMFKLYRVDSPSEMNCLHTDSQFRVDKLAGIAAKVRDYMQSPNVKNLVPKLNSMFQRKNYFAVAAYGVNVTEEMEEGRKAPYGVILPFLWTLTNFGYFQTVKYQQSVKSTGLFHKTPVIIESFEDADRQELYYE